MALPFTFIRRCVIVVIGFDENKHPRDKDGKFTVKGGPKEYRQNTSYDEILFLNSNTKKVRSQDLTKQEWALWYKSVSENKKQGYWAETTESGYALLKVENNNSHKIVITSGTFEKPKAKAVYSFKDSDVLNDALEELKRLW